MLGDGEVVDVMIIYVVLAVQLMKWVAVFRIFDVYDHLFSFSVLFF